MTNHRCVSLPLCVQVSDAAMTLPGSTVTLPASTVTLPGSPADDTGAGDTSSADALGQ